MQFAAISASLLLIFLILLGYANCINQVFVERNPRDPSNPLVLVNSSRPETYYRGPLHLFGTSYGMRHASLKMDMLAGEHQCFYFVLIEGFHFTVFAASIATDDNKFHMFVGSSDPLFQRTFSDQTSVTMEANITMSDTYEVCIVNPHGPRSILFSALYYPPVLYDLEVTEAIAKNAVITNISDTSVNYVSRISVNVMTALNTLRYNPILRRDYVLRRDTNSYVQWKSIGFIGLMLLSFGGTTLFIRHLFHVPSGKVAI